jgi:protein-S-isoprenylcysteine O-methyltransferase Ste14
MIPRHELRRKALTRILMGCTVLAATLFLSAGTLVYWEAWVYLGLLCLGSTGLAVYLLGHAPDLLERRLRTLERAGPQRPITALFGVVFLAILVLPGLDERYGWSSVQPLAVVAADAIAVLGYAMFGRVLSENRYASRTIEVDQGQRVVATGLYAIVRHPMYVAILVLYGATPIALGSYWALIPVAAIPFLLVARINNEEAVLIRELPGYREYMGRTKFRLVPGVW